MLTVKLIDGPSWNTKLDFSTASRNRSAICNPASIEVSGNTTANSSPPIRPSKSNERVSLPSTREKTRKASSPVVAAALAALGRDLWAMLGGLAMSGQGPQLDFCVIHEMRAIAQIGQLVGRCQPLQFSNLLPAFNGD